MGGFLSTTSSKAQKAAYMNEQYKPPTYDDNEDKVQTKKVKRDDLVIIPVDRGTESLRAFNFYVEHIHSVGNKVHLIHCSETEQPSGANYPDYAIPPESWGDTMQNQDNYGQGVLRPYKELLKQHQISGEAYVVYGKPGKAIISTQEHTNASMIVMGSRGLGPIARRMVGSVSEFVLRKSTVPVTVVPPPTKLDLFWYILH